MPTKLRGLADLLPTLALIAIVLGTIYGGLATPTESAALGVVAAIVLAAIDRRLSWSMLNAASEAAARNTALIGLILFGAYLLNYVLTSLGVPQAMANSVAGLPSAAMGDHAADHRILPGARHLHGRVFHGDHHDPGDLSGCEGAGLRSRSGSA